MKTIKKKSIFMVLSLTILSLSFYSCEDSNYKKACEERDWSKAYKIVGSNYDALKYVMIQEALFVLEEFHEDGLVRIVGIAKEHDAEKWLYDELATTMRSAGKVELADKIQKMNPYCATLSCATPVVGGILKGYFEVDGQEAKIINGKLRVHLKRIKKGVPPHKQDYIKLYVTIKDGNGLIIDTYHGSTDWYYPFELTQADDINEEFIIDKEAFEMKSFFLTCTEYTHF